MDNIPKKLIFKQMEVGPMENFQYFIGCAETNEIAVIDPAWDVPFLLKEAKNNGYTITNVFFTHGHHDHINGLDEILSKCDVPAFISKHEADMYKPKHKNLVEIESGAKLKVGNIEIDTLLTPGHSPGCQCIIYENVCVIGDTLFVDGCGRCDLPGSDPKQQYNSLYNVVMKLDDDTIIFPGHNYGPTPYATLANQKAANPYLNCVNEEEFLMQRM